MIFISYTGKQIRMANDFTRRVNKASVNIPFLCTGSVIFILCWAPYYCYSIYRDFFPDHWRRNKDRMNIFIIIEVCYELYVYNLGNKYSDKESWP